MWSWWWLACTAPPGAEDTGVLQTDLAEGPLGLGAANPFPSLAQVADDGHLALRSLPSEGRTRIPVDRLAWRRGFSPVQTSVLELPGIAAEGLPTFDQAPLGEGTVEMYDLTEGVRLPCMAELDAHPQAADAPSLLVRPLTAVPDGHRVAVVVSEAAVARPVGFDPERPLTRRLLDELAELGVAGPDVAVAWEYPVADGTRPLRSALAQRQSEAPAPIYGEVREGDDAVAGAWRVAEGTFLATGVLADGLLALTDDGSVEVSAEPFEIELYVHIPPSVADAPAGSVPIVLFGHGLFRSPEAYLDVSTDDDGVLALANEGRFIVVATRWRGLSDRDLGVALDVAGDFGQIPRLTSLMVQSQVAVRELAEGFRSAAWVQDPVFQGASGQALPDRGSLFYYGISLGGIEGGVLMALEAPIDAAVLHVPGAMWSTMLERSSNWALFEAVFVPAIEDPADRQRLYALSQLWWDPVDPASYVELLGAQPVLLQAAVGDEQVPNFTTEALARAARIPLLEPAALPPPELPTVTVPVADGTAVLAQFDPEVALPAPTNRPAAVTQAHTRPRLWSGARQQAIAFMDSTQPGRVVHLCGETACAASNPGP